MADIERPFGSGTIVTPDDWDWVAGRLRDFRIRNLETDIQGSGIHLEQDEENKFLLSNGLVKIGVNQDEGKTTISFLPNEELSLKTEVLYSLFFQKIPESIYSNLGSGIPLPELVQNSTIVTLETDPPLPRKMNLGLPSHKEYFEDFIEEYLSEIVSLTMAAESKDIVPFSLTLPNLKKKLGDVEFSFSSTDTLTQKTMEVLLGLHRFCVEPQGEQNYYAKSFTTVINAIREEVGVRKK